MFPSQGAQSVEKSLQSPLSMAANGTANAFDLDAHKRFPLKFESEGPKMASLLGTKGVAFASHMNATALALDKCALVATGGQCDQPNFKVREPHLPCTLAMPTPLPCSLSCASRTYHLCPRTCHL